MRDVIHVTESDTALKFSTQYIAEDLGFFNDVNLDVRCDVAAGPGGSWLVDNLIANKAQVAIGGIWLPLLYTQIGLGRFVPFAAACHRGPSVVLGRVAVDGPFSWDMLYGKRILLSMAATSQWMFFEGLLKRSGVEMSRIKFVRDLHADTMRALWRAGYGDFYVMMDPLPAEQLASEGSPIAFTMAAVAGNVPWSVFYTSIDMVERPDQPIARFKSAIERANSWLIETPINEVSLQLSKRFPNVSQQQITSVISRFIATGVWQKTCEIDPVATSDYQQIMVSYGLLDHEERLLPAVPASAAPGIPA